jgi:hypothetical protein
MCTLEYRTKKDAKKYEDQTPDFIRNNQRKQARKKQAITKSIALST